MDESATYYLLMVVYLLGLLLMGVVSPRPKHEYWMLAKMIVVVFWPIVLLSWIAFRMYFRKQIGDHETATQECR